jgi:hypothetical protein
LIKYPRIGKCFTAEVRREKFYDDDNDDCDYDYDYDNNNLVLLTLQIKALLFFDTSGTSHPASHPRRHGSFSSTALRNSYLTSVLLLVKDISVTNSLKLPFPRLWDHSL